MGASPPDGYVPLQSAPAPPILVVYVDPERGGGRRRHRRVDRHCSCSSAWLCGIVLALVAAVALWPREVHIDVRNVKLLDISWKDEEGQQLEEPSSLSASSNRLYLDVKLGLELRIWNTNVYGVRYDEIKVDLGYRGSKLGQIVLQQGRIPPLSIVTVPATMDVDATVGFLNAASLVMDIVMGDLPLETTVDFAGRLELFFSTPRIQTKLGCDINVNPKNREILRQFCLVQA